VSDTVTQSQPAAEPKQQPDTEIPRYAVVEIFGHRQHAGRVLEVEQFGSKMLRIDVPKTGDDGAASFDIGYETHFYGGASIFSFSLTDLATVVRMNKGYAQAGHRSLPDYSGDDDPEPEEFGASAGDDERPY
jgi:hypothetical protein